MPGAESTALIAAGPGSLRESLRAMLVSMFPDAVILEADDTAAAERLLCERRVNLLVIDSEIPGNHTMQLVKTARMQKPRPRCFILVDTVFEQAAAMKEGADYVPFKGEPASRVFSQVERLLSGAAPSLQAA